MKDLQSTSNSISLNALWKRSLLCLALLLAFYPLVSQQKLTANSRRVPTSPKATGKIFKAPTMFPHGGSASGSSHPQMSAMTTGNVTLEGISERLVRMDDSLAGLIQGVLTVQRTVFNLEQLQELLVLLLEDILKQTSGVDKIPRTDTNPVFGGGKSGGRNSGGTSLSTDSDDKDSADVASADIDDGTEEEQVTANPNENAGVGKVNGRGNEPGIRTSLSSGPFGARNEQFSMSALIQNGNGFSARQSTDPNTTGRGEDSAGGSSEGGKSNSNEDYASGFMRVMQRNTQPANIPVPNSPRSQWSEPIMAHGRSDNPSRFFDVVHRMVSQLGQTTTRTSPRLLGLMHGKSVSHQKAPESILEHPPVYEPLEIVSAHDDTVSNEKRPVPRMMPIKVKLLPESVISHGGPRTGPEHYSSLYLEHPEEHHGAESTGETSTGMISNLVKPDSNHAVGNDSRFNTSQADDYGQANIETVVTGIRKKRETFNNALLVKNIHADIGQTESVNDIRHNVSEHGNDNLIVTERTSSRDVKPSMSSINFTTTGNRRGLQYEVRKDSSGNVNSSHGIIQETIVQASKVGGQEYDDLIAQLLTDLSTQLHTVHQESNVGSDDTFRQALHELDKLIWVSTENVSNSFVTFDVTNTSDIDEEIETTDDVKRITVSGENILHPFSVETNLNRELSKKYGHDNGNNSLRSNRLYIMKANDITNTRKDNKSNDKYAMPPREGDGYREMLIAEQERMRHVNRQVVSTKTTVASKSDSENVTARTYEEFDWLYQLMGNSELLTTDVKSLIDALNNLSRIDSFVEEVRELNDRARSILTMTLYTSQLQKNVDPSTHIDNVTVSDDDHVNDDSTLISPTGGDSSSSEEDGTEEGTLLIKTGIRKDVFKTMEKDGSPRNAHSKDIVNFNLNPDVSDDKQEDSKSTERKENDDESDDDNSSEDRDFSENIPDKSQIKENKDAWLLKTTSGLEPRSQINSQSSLLSARQAGSLHPDANVNNIGNKFNYRKPRAIENQLHDVNAAVNTQTLSKQIQNVISRQKRQINLRQNIKSLSNHNSRDVPNQHTSLSQAHLPSDNKDVINSRSGFSGSLVESTNNTESSSPNATHSSSNVDVPNDIAAQQLDVKYVLNNSHITETNQQNAQGYEQSASNLQTFDSHVNGFAHTFNIPDYESFGGTSSPEETETPSAEEHSALDLEDVLTSLFLTYWQRFYHLYTRASPLTTTPSDVEAEEEVTEATLTTEASPIVANVTANSTTYLTPTPSMATSSGKDFSNTTLMDTVRG